MTHPLPRSRRLRLGLRSELQQLESPHPSRERTAAVQRLEAKVTAELRDIQACYRVTRPRISLTKTARADWERYRSKYIDLSATVFDPARQLVASLVDDALGSSDRQRRVRAETTLENLSSEVFRLVHARRRTVIRKADTVLSDIRHEAKACAKALVNDVLQMQADFYRTDLSESTAADFIIALAKAETEIAKAGDSASDLLQHIELAIGCDDRQWRGFVAGTTCRRGTAQPDSRGAAGDGRALNTTGHGD